MKVDPVTVQSLAISVDFLRYHNKQQEISRVEDHLRIQKQQLARMEFKDPEKGNKVDITV